MAENTEFRGPVFVIGMPRSGTKLLRDVLNNHSLIGITPNESHFIPYYQDRISEFGELQDFNNFQRFYKEFAVSVFFKRVTENDPFIDAKKWYDAVEEWTYPGVIEAFYLSYAHHKNKKIWGDKTPYYHLHVPLLKELFPEAKFIHIIRDVRDYCLSLNKSWKKNLFRSAQRWNDTILKCRKDVTKIPAEDYVETRYEKLVDEPAETLKMLCDFVGVAFEEEMVKLTRRTENLGDAKDFVGIMEANYGKWRKKMSDKQINRIEQICGDLLKDLDYPVSYEGPQRPLSKSAMGLYKLIDGFSLLKFEISHNHLREGLSNFFKARKYLQYRTADES